MNNVTALTCGHWFPATEIDENGNGYCELCMDWFPIVSDDDDDEPDCDHFHNAANQYHTTNCNWPVAEESAR